jgi:hypothetical protein
MLLLLPGQMGDTWETRNAVLFRKMGVRIENYNYLVFKGFIICPSGTKIIIIEVAWNLDWEMGNL